MVAKPLLPELKSHGRLWLLSRIKFVVRKNYTKNVVMFSFKAVTHKNVMIKIEKYPGKLATVETVASL